MTSVKCKITLWFRVNNVNPVLLRVGSVASKSSVLNLLLIFITLLAGKFQIKTPLQSCYRSYLMIRMNVYFFVFILTVDLLTLC